MLFIWKGLLIEVYSILLDVLYIDIFLIIRELFFVIVNVEIFRYIGLENRFGIVIWISIVVLLVGYSLFKVGWCKFMLNWDIILEEKENMNRLYNFCMFECKCYN